MISMIAQQLDGATENRPSFVVGAGPGDVALVPPAAQGHLIGPATSVNRYFAAGDSVNVLSLGLVLPYGFTLGRGAPGAFDIHGVWSTGFIWALDVQQCAPRMLLTFPNAEQAMGMYLTPVVGPVGWTIEILPLANSIYLSMFNVPAALVGSTQYAYFWAKVEHTLPMVAA